MEELTRLRARIDALDGEIAERIAQRFEVCRMVAGVKRNASITMMQPDRVTMVEDHYQQIGHEQGIPTSFTTAFVGLLIKSTCDMENEIIDGSATGSVA